MDNSSRQLTTTVSPHTPRLFHRNPNSRTPMAATTSKLRDPDRNFNKVLKIILTVIVFVYREYVP